METPPPPTINNIEAQVPSIGMGSFQLDNSIPPQPNQLRSMFLVASIALAIQFSWAQQVSLITSYIKLLGIHKTTSVIIFMCGPVTGLLLSPTVGYYSDQCTSFFGRRRPFIVGGIGLVVFALFLVGYAVDIGNYSIEQSHSAPNIGYFLVGFYILGVGTIMANVTCRALLADMAANDHSKIHIANSAFSFFMASGTILGFAAGSYHHLYLVFPFSRTIACDINCANFKSCTIISIALLITLTSLALSFISEKTFIPSVDNENEQGGASRFPFIKALKEIGHKPSMWILLLVTFLNMIALFLFISFDTDWMGREIYGGQPGQWRYKVGTEQAKLGLMLNFLVLGVMSIAIEPLRRWVGGANRLWGIVNLVLALCLAMTVLVTKMAQYERHEAALGGAVVVPMPSATVKASALALVSLLGIPLAVTFATPFALASILSASSGIGQGLSIGVLHVAIAITQILVYLSSGPLDARLRGDKLPPFVFGALMATASAILSFTLLPS